MNVSDRRPAVNVVAVLGCVLIFASCGHGEGESVVTTPPVGPTGTVSTFDHIGAAR